MLLIRTVLDRRLPYLLYSSRVDRVKFRVLETAACVMCHVSCVMMSHACLVVCLCVEFELRQKGL